MKVFLVEDSPHICERLKEIIEEQGEHTVVGCADTVGAAIQGITGANPDVGIFDIQLKDGNGIAVLAQVKRGLPDLVGLVLSGEVNAERAKAAKDAGASYVLDKSLDFDRIYSILTELSHSRPLP